MQRMFRHQPRLAQGSRDPLPSCVIGEIKLKIELLAEKHRVSKSWVIATILADALRVQDQVSYLERKPKRGQAKASGVPMSDPRKRVKLTTDNGGGTNGKTNGGNGHG